MAQQAPADIEHDFAGELCSITVGPQIYQSVHLCFWAVYGKKPSKNQKDHREQLLANHKPVEKMAGRRMVCPSLHPAPTQAQEPRLTTRDTAAVGGRWAS